MSSDMFAKARLLVQENCVLKRANKASKRDGSFFRAEPCHERLLS